MAGNADVFVDGKFVQQIDMYYREEAGKYDVNRAHIFHILGLKDSLHTLKLVVSDKKNPRSAGHKIRVEILVVFSTEQMVYITSRIYKTKITLAKNVKISAYLAD